VDKPTEKKKQDKPKRKPGRPKKVKVEALEQPASEQPGELYLSETEVLRLRLFHAEQERSLKAYTLATISRASYLKQVDPQDNLSKLDADIRSSAASSEEARKRYQETVQSAESRLGIKLTEYTFDGDTGLLRKIQ